MVWNPYPNPKRIPTAGGLLLRYLAKKVLSKEKPKPTRKPSGKYSKSAQKGIRTKCRKRRVKTVLTQQRTELTKQLRLSLESSALRLGKVMVKLEGDKIVISTPGANMTGKTLAKAREIIGDGGTVTGPTSGRIEVTLPCRESIADKAVKLADEKYGELAGMKASNEYVEKDDPYLQQLDKLISQDKHSHSGPSS